jgi:hypothetical protein
MIKLIKSVYKLTEQKTYEVDEEVDFGKDTNQYLLDKGYAEEIRKVTKERKRTIKKK